MQLTAGSPALKAWLDRDPVGNAYLVHRAFFEAGERRVLVDDADRPTAMVVAGAEGRLVAGGDGDALRGLLQELPSGAYHIAALDVDLLPAVEEVMETETETPAWLFRVEEGALRPTRVQETRPVRPEHAGMIAERWLGGAEAEDYVRARIEGGPTAGIYVDGELVAWDLTHVETDQAAILGFLHVRRPYRGRGFAKTVTTAVCDAVFGAGKIAGCHVFEDNEVSLRLTESMGFQRLKRQVWGRGRKG